MVAALLVVFGLYEVALGLLLWLAPGFFFHDIGPYGPRANDHYMADNGTWYLALGAVSLVAAGRPRWWLPIVAVSFAQNTLHLLSHLLDIGESHPGWHGPLDSVLLAVASLVLGWMLVVSARTGSAG